MLLLPILVYIAHIPLHESIATSLLIVGSTSLLGLLLNLKDETVDLRVGAMFAPSGIVGAWIGAAFTHLVPARALLLCFASLMVIIGTGLLKPWAGNLQAERTHPVHCLVLGGAVGLLTGFLGVGGGFIIGPALVLVGGLDIKVAIGTSLGLIAFNSFAGLAGQLTFIHLKVPATLGLVAAGSAGMLPGFWLSKQVEAAPLRRMLGVSIIVLGGCILLKNLVAYA